MDCIRCQIPLRRMALRTRPNHWDDHHPRAALRLIDTDDDTVYVTNPFDDLAFTQTHSALDAWVCPRCGHVELVASHLETLFPPERPEEKICPNCGKTVQVEKDSPQANLCPCCGKDFYEKIPGKTYIRPKNF